MSDPKSIAASLFTAMAEHVSETDHPRFFDIPEVARVRFAAKMKLYREASILMRLWALANSRPHYQEVLAAYEDLIYPDRDAEKLIKIEALNYAMLKLDELLKQEYPQDLQWAKEWLQGIGYTELNPVNLARIVVYWLSQGTMVSEALLEFCP